MLYPESLEQKLGFDKIRQALREECVSAMGQRFVDKIQFSNNYDLIDKFAKQTAEFYNILVLGEDFPSQNYLDLSPQLSKASLENAFLTEAEFHDLKLSLQTIYQCVQFLRKRPAEMYPQLRELAEPVGIDPDLIKHIELVIDERGKVRDNASFELKRIRVAILQEQNNLRKTLDSILRHAKSSGFAKDDAQLTLRDGRMVIPIASEHKRKIKGFVHDESATGQTVYLEPTEVLDLNNEIRELEYQEKREIIRILTELTNKVRPYIPDLKEAYRFLGVIDFVRAKAKFAQKIRAINPFFEKTPIVKWRQARHPLLYINHTAQGKPTIPLDIRLEASKRILLISGPNAGGKSVALKTVGLLQYMYQCGLLVPVAEGTTFGLFRDIFIDMGDEQSIENDLSTYSSHLTNMRHFLKHADKNSLLLIDEFGTGTEPAMGGAIAEAILVKLNQAKAWGVVTTHYTNLKFLAENTEGLVNGAMLFDSQHLEPLYQLEIGRPGSSFAFEIAGKIGLPKEVINMGRDKVGVKQVNIDTLLRELEHEKKVFSDKNALIAQKEASLTELTEKYDKLRNQLDNDKKIILNRAKQEAQNLVKEANKRIENTIKEIKDSQARQEVVKEARQELQTYTQVELKQEKVDLPVEENSEIEVIGGEIEIGDKVRIKESGAIGEVLALKGKDVEILIGELKSTVKLIRLERVNRQVIREQKKEIARSFTGIDVTDKFMNFSTRIDIRGMRGEEALDAIGEFIDDAILTGQSVLQVVHGKGDGILRKLIREALRKYSQVQKMEDEHADRGGDGVTWVYLR
jgi:DNA mismatch repair protein MutS2